MENEFKVVTLCGSTRFKEDFLREQERLVLEGKIVLLPCFFEYSQNDVFDEKIKLMLGDMHKWKIDMSDEIFVINKKGYVGSSTKSEIEYALKTNKKVVFMEQKSE